MTTTYCPTCRTHRDLMDTYTTGPLGAEYVAQPLSCGHDAGDGGGRPYQAPRPAPAETQANVDTLVALQAGALSIRDSRTWATLAGLAANGNH